MALLLSGDLERAGEARLREWWGRRWEVSAPPAVLAWHANHHGSRTSTQRETLELLRPRLVLLSLGWLNGFQFPHPETLARLRWAGASAPRTDLNGAIEVRFGWGPWREGGGGGGGGAQGMSASWAGSPEGPH